MTTIALIAGLAACATSVRAPNNGEVTAIRHVSVISGTTPSLLRDATVLIRDNRITAVGPSRSIPVPKGARIVDGHGTYLIPGLINTHVHVARLVGTPQLDGALALELAHGVTGVRDASASGRERELVAIRERINRGELLAPRLYVSGSGTPRNIPLHKAQGFADLVRKLAEVGVDGIKLRNLTRLQLDTVIMASRAAGLPAFGHTYGLSADSNFTLRAIDSGAAGVMHALGIGPASRNVERTIAATGWQRGWLKYYLHWVDATPAEETELLRRLLDNHVWLEPTLTTETFALYDEWYRGRPETALVWWEPFDSARVGFPKYSGADLDLAREAYRRMTNFVSRFQEAGGLVLAGTDMTPWPGAGIHEELRLLVDAGLTPVQALQAATINAATALGWKTRTGSIEVGKDADLVLLDANPLVDITNTARIRAVFRAGKMLDRSALDSLRALIKAP